MKEFFYFSKLFSRTWVSFNINVSFQYNSSAEHLHLSKYIKEWYGSGLATCMSVGLYWLGRVLAASPQPPLLRLSPDCMRRGGPFFLFIINWKIINVSICSPPQHILLFHSMGRRKIGESAMGLPYFSTWLLFDYYSVSSVDPSPNPFSINHLSMITILFLSPLPRFPKKMWLIWVHGIQDTPSPHPHLN